jgi:hypothetical protein
MRRRHTQQIGDRGISGLLPDDSPPLQRVMLWLQDRWSNSSSQQTAEYIPIPLCA